MARLPLVSRLRREPSPDETGEQPAPDLPPEPAAEPPPAAAAPQPKPRRRVAPPPGELRRERRALMRLREDRLRDLGGLALEMYRRDRFNADLLVERCTELLGLEARIHELAAYLALSSPLRLSSSIVRCACGAPLLPTANFCGNCGRPAREARGGA